MTGEPATREPKQYEAHLSSVSAPSMTTDFLVSRAANRWIPPIVALAGGLLLGAMLGVAAWVSASSGQTGYAVAFAVTGASCSFLPLVVVKLALWWVDTPLQAAAKRDRSTSGLGSWLG